MYIKIKKRENIKPIDYQPTGVIMGKTGSGKTTLLNKICGTNYEAGASSSSLTRNLFKKTNDTGDHAFELIDTPGTNSTEERFKHAYLLKHALTCSEINTIFILLKYDNRFDNLLESYLFEQKTVDQFDEKIILMISHADQSLNPDADFKSICEKFEDWCANIIFYSDKCKSDELANYMYACMSQMKKEKLTINGEDFLLKFDIATVPRKREMIKEYNAYELNLKKTNKELEDLAKEHANIPDIDERDDILRTIIVLHKDEMDSVLSCFREKFKDQMAELNSYCLYIKLQKEIVEMCDLFIQFITPLLSYNITNPHDPRNIYKRCPHCKLVWVKVVGCDNVSCGDRIAQIDSNGKALRKFVFERKDGKYSLKKSYEDLKEFIKSSLKTPQNNLNQNYYSINGIGRGCGETFNWKTQAIGLGKNEIYELLTVKTIDEAIELIKSQSFTNSQNSYINQLDTSMY